MSTDFSQETLSLLERIASGIEKIGNKPSEPEKNAGRIVPENRLEEVWICILRLGKDANLSSVARAMGYKNHMSIKKISGAPSLLDLFHKGRQASVLDRRASASEAHELYGGNDEWDD